MVVTRRLICVPTFNTTFVRFQHFDVFESLQRILITLIEVQTDTSFIEVLVVDNIFNILVMSSCMSSRCRSKTFKRV